MGIQYKSYNFYYGRINLEKRFKLYKSGKLWCCAAVAFATLTIGATSVVHADVNTATPVQQELVTTNNFNQTSSAVASVKVQQPVTNRVPQDTTTTNNDVNANKGNLDHYQINNDAKTGQSTIQFNGWHVVGKSNTESYRYAILYDNTAHQEVQRVRITPVNRPDVQKANSNVDDSLHSGFNVQFKLRPEMVGQSLSLITRYSTDAINGEGEHTDFWFAPITIDDNNQASLDSITSDKNGNLNVTGWHATNQALNKQYHYIIAFDQTRNQEIARQRVLNGQRRFDVAQVYPTVVNAANSGFNVSFKLTPQYSRDNIQFISRWTDDPAGNGAAVDYWFGPVQKQNRGNMDSWNLSNGTLQVSGWHANDASIYQPYHYLILFDDTTGQQVTSVKVPTSNSSDVASVYRDTRSANKARFSYNFTNRLRTNHTYSIISRYSAYDTGNGDDGVAEDHTDYWFKAEDLNQRAYSLDSVTDNGNHLTVSGWMANDASLDDAHPFLILLNNGHEVGRKSLKLTQRSDVAKVYPQIYNSDKSGFTTTFIIPSDLTGDLQFVLRFSNQLNGEGEHDDMWSTTYTTNDGHFDHIYTNGRTLHVDGWHATDGSLSKQYQYLFAMDNLTGQELYRWAIPAAQANTARGDVQHVYPWIANSGRSGFNVSVNVPDQITGHEVRFMHRYTDDAAGNGDTVDYWDGGIFYFNSDSHAMAVNQFVTILDPHDNYPDGRPHTMYSVYFGNDGRMVFGNQNINGQWYSFEGGSGKMDSFSQRVIDWFRGRRHRLTYSMYGTRNGADGTADCSGSMTQALRDAGASPYGALYSTENLHGYLRANGYYLAGEGTGRMQVQYGDIIIWGRRGYSSGGAGHTVTISSFGNGDNILCISTCGYNHHQWGEAVQEYNYYRYCASDGYIYQYIYRPYNLARR